MGHADIAASVTCRWAPSASMQLDIPTLMAAGALATAVAGLLTVIAWLADREAKALP